MDDDDPNMNWNDKGDISDWFSFDFTLAELKTVRKIQPNEFRDPRYDGQERVATLEELVDITRSGDINCFRVIHVWKYLIEDTAKNRKGQSEFIQS